MRPYIRRSVRKRAAKLLPRGLHLIPQVEGDFGVRLLSGAIDLLEAGFDGAIMVNSGFADLAGGNFAGG